MICDGNLYKICPGQIRPQNSLGRVRELHGKCEFMGGLTRTLVERKLAEIDRQILTNENLDEFYF
jgi:hypothetical protein